MCTAKESPCKESVPGPSLVPNTVPVSERIPISPYHWEAVHRLTPSVFSVPGSGTKIQYISCKQGYDAAAGGPGGMELGPLITLSDSKHSDLIPGVYEGGLKLWECALDLVQFLAESNLDFSRMRVLELGCGLGLPGIYTAMQGARSVDFQDYNAEVLKRVTIPNVILNVGSKIRNSKDPTTKNGPEIGNGNDTTKGRLRIGNENAIKSGPENLSGGHAEASFRIENETGNNAEVIEHQFDTKNQSGTDEIFRFYSGDWSGLVPALEPVEGYDLILTSETIYSLASQPKLLSILKQLSAARSGVVYVAAKTFYFGVGGGVASFCQLLEEDGTFSVCQCRKILANVPRVILKLTHKNQ